MKSARDANLRTWFEFAYELFAQYLLTGKITFNPLPPQMPVSQGAWGRKGYASTGYAHRTGGELRGQEREMWGRDLDYYARELESWLDSVLESAVDNIFVM